LLAVSKAVCLELGTICRSIADGDHQAPPKANEGVPFITISAINDGTLRLEKATRHVPYAYYRQLKPSRVPKRGDVLFSVTGSIGIPVLVSIDAPFVFQKHIVILKPDPERIRENIWSTPCERRKLWSRHPRSRTEPLN
jgi:type I restriction enzyme S subunit